MELIPWYVLLVRLLVPLLILRSPLLGILTTIFVDINDWHFIPVHSPGDDLLYQQWDKAMDLYTSLFILWILRSWRDIWARRVALLLFGYRLIGMIWFWATDWRPILFFFPNVFENFVVVCLLLFHLRKKNQLQLSARQKTSLLAILFIPKLIHEYFQHFLGRQPWELYDMGQWVGWGGLLYLVPILGFVLYVWRGAWVIGKR